MNTRMAGYILWSVSLLACSGCAPAGGNKWVWESESTNSTKPTDQLRAKLASLISVNFDCEELGRVIDHLHRAHGVNFSVNWPALEAVAIEKDNEVQLCMNQASLAQVLNALTEYVGASETEVWWEADRDAINISTAEDMSRRTVLRIYDVADIIHKDWAVRVSPEPFVYHGFCDAPDCPHHGRRPQGGCFGPDFRPTCTTCGNFCSCQALPYLTGADALIELLVHRVHYGSWRVHGGNVGYAQAYGPFLVIQQTRKAHDEIEAFLVTLRNAAARH